MSNFTHEVTPPDDEHQIVIEGASYRAHRFGDKLVVVTKFTSRESYAVYRDTAGELHCSCPDFEHRHQTERRLCKHADAVSEASIL
jgi:hypothetical protein